MEGQDEKEIQKLRLRARKRMMDLIAHRDHSEKEIREKLADRHEMRFIDEAVDYGRDHGWIPDNEESQNKLANKLAESLHKKGKGILSINYQLKEKGLPPVETDSERELEKAMKLVATKFTEEQLTDRNVQAKAGRFLASRGFDMDTVRQVIFKR